MQITFCCTGRVGKGARKMICIVDRSSTPRAVPTRSFCDGGHGAQERAFAHPTILIEAPVNPRCAHLWPRAVLYLSPQHPPKGRAIACEQAVPRTEAAKRHYAGGSCRGGFRTRPYQASRPRCASRPGFAGRLSYAIALCPKGEGFYARILAGCFVRSFGATSLAKRSSEASAFSTPYHGG
jgi:hypothetical protein